MKAWRNHLPHLMPLVAMLFVTGIAVPRSALVFHVHAGGDHLHAHGDELVGDAHVHDADHDREEHHHLHADSRDAHHHHGTAADHDDTAFEAPEPVHLGHWHSQSPFHRTVAPGLARLVTVLNVLALARDVQTELLVASLPPDRARGPPTVYVG